MCSQLNFFSSFLPLEIVSREIKTNEHKLENNRRPHIIDLLPFWGEIVTS
jgi:hypothetical protein